MEQITYKLDLFEGPLDLLLSLIEKNKLDINDIPISLLCDQYLDYLKKAEDASIELSAEFVVMATELMLIKSRMLLPRTSPEEEDPRADLAAALLEYQRAKEAAKQLGPRHEEYGLRMTKDTDEVTVDKKFVADHDAELLFLAYNRVLSSIRVSDEEAKKEFEPLIRQKVVSVAEVTDRLASRLSTREKVSLDSVFRTASSRHELVSMFMALLEMLKTGLLDVFEENVPEGSVINVCTDVAVALRPGTTDEEFSRAVADMKKSEY
ncbi:MAG: segregation/condensation protein A [Clostridia bacterium]|nr:segregation/condensation protein A [Clostridia bacterium]